MSKVFLFMINLYKIFLSPILGGRCRFYPTCSEYAQQAFKQYGVWHATKLSVKRLSKCHPWHPGGIDFCRNGIKETKAD